MAAVVAALAIFIAVPALCLLRDFRHSKENRALIENYEHSLDQAFARNTVIAAARGVSLVTSEAQFVANAARAIPLVQILANVPPPLEMKREKSERQAKNQNFQEVQIETGFECSTPLQVKQLSPTHFLVTLTSRQLKDWFMFRMEGVMGKTVRVDISGAAQTAKDNWTSLNPVYTSVRSLDNLNTYDVSQGKQIPPASMAWNGPEVPAMDSDNWHYIRNSWIENPTANVFSFVQDFDSESVYVAMRVPHPPGYNEQFFHQLSSNPLATVFEVGRSTENRPLLLAKIGSGGDASERRNPCILIYAGEHADEQDAMWVAQGAIDYLLSDAIQARYLRDHFTFLVIPMLDPDSAAGGRHQGIISSFLMGSRTCESSAYANWFQAWINSGKRLDIVFDFHNVQSKGFPQVSCALMEGVGSRGKASATLHGLIIKHLQEAGMDAALRPWMRGWSPDRLGGWLSHYYGPITLAYELNSQAPNRHLNLQQLKIIGGIFADSLPAFISSQDGLAILSDIDARREARLNQWAKYQEPTYIGDEDDDAIKTEAERAQELSSDSGFGFGALTSANRHQ